jgi:hypothetical protein
MDELEPVSPDDIAVEALLEPEVLVGIRRAGVRIGYELNIPAAQEVPYRPKVGLVRIFFIPGYAVEDSNVQLLPDLGQTTPD